MLGDREMIVSLDNWINFPDEETKAFFWGLAALFDKTENFPSIANLFFFLLGKEPSTPSWVCGCSPKDYIAQTSLRLILPCDRVLANGWVELMCEISRSCFWKKDAYSFPLSSV